MITYWKMYKDGSVGQAAGLMEWMRTFGEGRAIRQTRYDDGVLVSTIFLGLDSSFSFGPYEAEPVLYETMIFGGDHDGFQERHCTRREAEAGHEFACLLARGVLTPEELEVML